MACGLSLAAAGGQAFAADASSSSSSVSDNTVGEIVVTGSILRRLNYTTDAPLTVVTATDLQNRGITTVQAAIQSVSANGAGNLPNSFSSNGAFASGASGASLRGLTTNSTLVLIDGLRAAYYPLADDGTRNFVDLNTIPDIMVDHVEVLKDGTSATYGADAIAGVVNIMTKKSFVGTELRAEGGISQRGDAGSYTVQGMWGTGDLSTDGFNFYLAGEYENDNALNNNQLGFPYNTANLSSLCATSISGLTNQPGNVQNGETCRTNGITNGLQFDGTFASTAPGANTVPVVRPYTPGGVAAGAWQLLNPAAGCGSLPSITFTSAMLPTAGEKAALLGSTLCQQDLVNLTRQIFPKDQRTSVNMHVVKDFGTAAEFYLEGNYYMNDVTAASFVGPPRIRNTATPGQAGSAFSTASGNISLPVYICASGVNCSAANGSLNPQNPFAAMGDVARIYYRFGDIPEYSKYSNDVFRLATGVHGTLFDGWRYTTDLTYMESNLEVDQHGGIYISHLLNAINTGTYNFMNPSQNSAAENDYIAPVSVQHSDSQELEIQGTLSKDLFTLPGGPLQLAVGAAFRYEELYNPTANPDPFGGDPTNRYFDINPFGAIGSRNVKSAFFELDAPLLKDTPLIKELDINGSGRYDDYSTGQSHFSPKVGAMLTPGGWFDWLTMRGTWSQGFRIPSFAESNSLPSTGYVTVNAPASFQTAHGNNGYGQGYALGLTTVGTPGLQPETSTNFTGGFVVKATSHIQLSVDYYRITKNKVIAPADYTPAVDAYYAGQPIPAGYTVIPGVPDPDHPTLQPTIGFVEYGFANLDKEFTDGVDFEANFRYDLGPVNWSSTLDGNYVSHLNEYFPDGSVQHFAGTLGPYQTTSASGTPHWRFSWQNTFAYDKFSTTATVYFTDGYSSTAEDNGAIANDCLDSVGTGTPATYRDGATPIVCNVSSFVDVDWHLQYQLRPELQVYLDVSNLFGAKAPYDPTTYGGYQYNPAWANAGILGRYFKFGMKAVF